MGNILNDIVDEVNIKPSKSKAVIKWIITVSLSLITLAFVFGQFKTSFFNRMDEFEKSLNNNTNATTELQKEMKSGFDAVNSRIDKVYDDGYKAFSDFQVYNNKQLGFLIDYGGSNKDMLKRMLEINSIEKNRGVEGLLEKSKQPPVKNDSVKIKVVPIKK